MGGRSSGRHWHWDAKNTTDQYRSIDVRRWARDGLLEPGRQFGWNWTVDGETVSSIHVRAQPGKVRLIYRNRSYGEDWESLDYPVYLSSTPCHYGGHRDWFLCPAQGCARRVAVLYGGRIFACRHCHQLAYPSTREAGYQRSQRRADKILERLDWSADPDLYEGIKPKGMHWKTYDRLVSELDYWERQADAGFAAYAFERFGNFSAWRRDL